MIFHRFTPPLCLWAPFYPPLADAPNVVLASPNGMFNLVAKTWRTSSSVFCMAGVRNAWIDPYPMYWAANNALPLQVASSCRLYLSFDGDLILQYDDNQTAWHTHTAGIRGIANLTLFDSGNLVLQTKGGFVAWQSFDQSPVFALYSGMNLTSEMTVFSAALIPDGDSSFNVRGSYAMQLFNHSELVLFTNTNERFVYWSTSISNGTLQASTHQVSYVTLDNALTFRDDSFKAVGSLPSTDDVAANFKSSVKVSVVDPISANLLAFYRSNLTWTLFFNSSITACQNTTHCGSFAICNASTGACRCPPSFVQDVRDCKPKTDANSPAFPCLGPAEPSSYKFVSVNVSVQPQISSHTSPSAENCTLLCAHSCACRVALYDADTSSCSIFSGLSTVPSGGDSKQLMLLKLPMETRSSKKHLMVIVGSVCAVAVCLCTTCTTAFLHRSKQQKQRKKLKGSPNEEVFLQALPRLPPKYTYKELEEATRGFSTELGAGAFGGVYEGVLPTGVKVAVKKLEEGSKQSLVQFRAEVASIGSVSHMNLVTLKGFCHDGEGRLLVYEHMALGSLDRWLFRKGEAKSELGWERRCKIAMDTAKGLAYLHHECAERIVHCDVKPENILLDQDFSAKVGDFGLAKLVGKERQSFAMTTLKGTRGYLAPEWLKDATITAKSDVYSFGVVLLELISGRRSIDSDYGYLPTLAFRILSTATIGSSACSHGGRSPGKLQESPCKQWVADPANAPHASQEVLWSTSSSHSVDLSRMEALLDPWLCEDGYVPPASLECMIYIGLWCVQPTPAARPPMNVVVQMLEGVVPVPPPPLQMPFWHETEELFMNTSTTSSSTASRFPPNLQPTTLEPEDISNCGFTN
ncbi:hypothetical protein L7F22_012450 [Adiantum nelumboides]|nr:hypothetical protein [Adiantum nelumboides]